MVDWTQPTITSVYTQVLTDLDDRLDDCATMFGGTASTNLPTGTIRIDSADNNKLEKYNGATWDRMDLAVTDRLDIISGSISLVVGADSSAYSLTDAIQKTSRIGTPHYTLAEEPMALIMGISTNTVNSVYIGGATASFNAATHIYFYTTANNTTITGENAATISSTTFTSYKTFIIDRGVDSTSTQQIRGASTWRMYLGVSGGNAYISSSNTAVGGSGLYFRTDDVVGTATNALIINSSQDATFYGNILMQNLTPALTLNDSNNGTGGTSYRIRLEFQANGTEVGLIGFIDSTNNFVFETHNFNNSGFDWYAGGALQMQLTNAGDLSISGTKVQINNASSPFFKARDTTNTIDSVLQATDTTGLVGTTTNHPFEIRSNNTAALTIDTSQNATFAGSATATTVEATGDTAAGDNAAVGYTATQGIIITGQGSTYDVSLKNDADQRVLGIPTGTKNVDLTGDMTATGNISGAEVQVSGTDIFETIYPVGTIYQSTVSTNPATLFGIGTWTALEDRFLLGESATYTAGSTGGSANAIVVTHNHTVTTNTAENGSPPSIITGGTGSGTAGTSTTQNKGSSGTGKNMPPYLVVYMWERTA